HSPPRDVRRRLLARRRPPADGERLDFRASGTAGGVRPRAARGPRGRRAGRGDAGGRRPRGGGGRTHGAAGRGYGRTGPPDCGARPRPTAARAHVGGGPRRPAAVWSTMAPASHRMAPASSTNGPPDLTIIVPTYNESERLETLVAEIFAACEGRLQV